MHVNASRLWSQPLIVITLLKNLFVLDPTVLLGNPEVYFIGQKGVLFSFLAIKRHGSAYELKSVYTFPSYRGKNYMTLLMKHVVNRYSDLVLICKPRLRPFYERFGFRRVFVAPWFLRAEQHIANFFIPKRLGLVLMRRIL